VSFTPVGEGDVEVEGEAAAAMVTRSQGAQVGDGNVQVNLFPGDRRPMELISQDDEIKQRLGLPVSEDQPIGADGSGRIQFFDNGTVTLRDGEREIWLRPSFRET
jgi:hypothetical protein